MNNALHLSALKAILEKSFSRYIRVLPEGFLLPRDNQIFSYLTVQLSSYYSSRTLYQNKKPVCRSLDGVSSVKGKKNCSSCPTNPQCTPQICVEFVYQGIPLKLLLAYTSMRKFIEFVSRWKLSPNQEIKNLMTLTVLNRGKWGEVHFTSPV
jgi:hypothetical protein